MFFTTKLTTIGPTRVHMVKRFRFTEKCLKMHLTEGGGSAVVAYGAPMALL